MTKEEKVQQTIEKYLYTRDDLLDLNDVSEIARDLTAVLVVL